VVAALATDVNITLKTLPWRRRVRFRVGRNWLGALVRVLIGFDANFRIGLAARVALRVVPLAQDAGMVGAPMRQLRAHCHPAALPSHVT